MTTTKENEGKKWRTIPFDGESIEFDGTTHTLLELDPLVGAHLFLHPAQGATVGDVWTIGGLMAGLSEKATRHVCGQLSPKPLARLAEAVNEALGPYVDARQELFTFDTSKPYTLTLTTPVKQGSDTVSEVVLQPLKGSHVWDISGELTPRQLVEVAVRQSALPAVVFGRFAPVDFGRLMGVVDHFLGAFQPTSGRR